MHTHAHGAYTFIYYGIGRKILDVAILPDLIVSIYWASNSVLASCKGNATHANFILAPSSGAAAVFDIHNIHASIETIGLADSVYDNMVSSTISQKGHIETVFLVFYYSHWLLAF